MQKYVIILIFNLMSVNVWNAEWEARRDFTSVQQMGGWSYLFDAYNNGVPGFESLNQYDEAVKGWTTSISLASKPMILPHDTSSLRLVPGFGSALGANWILWKPVLRWRATRSGIFQIIVDCKLIASDASGNSQLRIIRNAQSNWDINVLTSSTVTINNPDYLVTLNMPLNAGDTIDFVGPAQMNGERWNNVGWYTRVCSINVLIDRLPTDELTLGAIRWDGWYSGNAFQRWLDPSEWHSRLPFFAEVVNTNTVKLEGDRAEVVDQEIIYARRGGIDYFAFDWYYPSSSAFNRSLALYLTSPYRNSVKFCLLLQGGHLGPINDWRYTVEYFIQLFRKPQYQTVMNGRPLIYIFNWEYFEDGFSGYGQYAIDDLRARVTAAGLPSPFIVVQQYGAMEAQSLAAKYDLDAISSYSGHAGNSAYSYEWLTIFNHNVYWDAYGQTGLQVVPIVNSGWDPRPMGNVAPWFQQATPRQIADNLCAAMMWTKRNPGQSHLKTLLIYAWNEYAEGGWLAPTHTEGTDRLDEIARIRGSRSYSTIRDWSMYD